MRALLIAIGFLTRIPVPPRVLEDARAQARSLIWYPAVGLLLGGLLAGCAWCLRDAPSLLRAALLLTAWVALTGAMHLDGLADSADAWIGGMGDRARTLAIMKDPCCGPAGVVAVVLVLLLKFAALASLPASAWPTLLLAPMLARAALVGWFLTTPYVRAGGLGDALQQAPRGVCLGMLLATVSVALVMAGGRGAWLLAAAVGVAWLWRRMCMRRIGGGTGDIAGALTEMVEAVVLVASALA